MSGRAWFVATLVLAACAPPPRDVSALVCAEEARAPHPRAQALSAWLDRGFEAGLPGLVLLVDGPEGRFLGARGEADPGTDTALRTCNRFRIGSTSKLLTAVAALQATEDGLLSLDVPLADSMPPALLRGLPNGRVLTLRHLLGQTSGLPDYVGTLPLQMTLFDEPRRVFTANQALDLVRGLPPRFAPGDRFEYSNVNYVLAGLVLETATGKPLAELLGERVFARAGMTHTSFDPTGSDPTDLVSGFFDLYGSGPVVDAAPFAFGKATPDGGLISTAADLERFLRALSDGRLLKPTTLAQMRRWTTVEDARFLRLGLAGYGLGLARIVHGELPEAIGHPGGMFGYTSETFFFPERDSRVVVLVNAGFGRFEERLRPLVLDDLLELALGE